MTESARINEAIASQRLGAKEATPLLLQRANLLMQDAVEAACMPDAPFNLKWSKDETIPVCGCCFTRFCPLGFWCCALLVKTIRT